MVFATKAGVACRMLCALTIGWCLGCKAPARPSSPVETWRIGVLPDENTARLRARYAPLVSYLHSELKIPVELVFPSDYDDALTSLGDGSIHLAYLGGYTFVRAHRQVGAVPLVVRRIDRRFTSCFLVPHTSTATTVEDCRGQRLAFGARLSTSGHLMPRHFLMERKVEPESFFSEVRYSGAHDRTAQLVASGEIDIGAVNSPLVDNLFKRGKLTRQQVKVPPGKGRYCGRHRPAVQETGTSAVLQQGRRPSH